MKHITFFETHTEYESAKPNLVLPNVSYCDDVHEVHYNPYVHDYSQDYFTTVALSAGTISFNDMSTGNKLSYSTDGGENWTEMPSSMTTLSVSVNPGAKVLWKGTATPDEDEGIGNFTSTASFNVEGNAMSLLFDDGFKGQTSLSEKENAFVNLLGDNETLVSAENLSLPATTLAMGCYFEMFVNCTNLTIAPTLPATTLAEGCYADMFRGCSSLATAPQLPATTLANSCYFEMFSGCTSLATAPRVLPATGLDVGCYASMFEGCESLIEAPELLATTLAEGCYASMFNGCSSLTAAPELPATTLAPSCYRDMFNGCTSLNRIICLATDISETNCTTNWVSDVASSGTFTMASGASWGCGVDGIPSCWTYMNDDGTDEGVCECGEEK